MGAEADVRMPLTAHLEELRTRIIRSLLAIAGGFLASYGFSDRLVAWLLRPLTAIRPDQALVIEQCGSEAPECVARLRRLCPDSGRIEHPL